MRGAVLALTGAVGEIRILQPVESRRMTCWNHWKSPFNPLAEENGMKDRGLRILRGWIGALICTCLAAASHTAVDGIMPPPAILGLLLCISAVICTSLASGKISLLRT